jgi:hypothetical protein
VTVSCGGGSGRPRAAITRPVITADEADTASAATRMRTSQLGLPRGGEDDVPRRPAGADGFLAGRVATVDGCCAGRASSPSGGHTRRIH